MPIGRRCGSFRCRRSTVSMRNPAYGMKYTAGSNAVRVYFQPMRTFGAQVRYVLLDNAAKRLGVPVEELTTEPSVVVHAKSGRRFGYGEIAAFAEMPDQAPEITPVATEEAGPIPPDRQGRDAGRGAEQGEGHAQYAIDVQVPGMLYGAVLRAPVEGAAPERIDDAGHARSTA